MGISGGSAYHNGAVLELLGRDHPSGESFRITVHDKDDNSKRKQFTCTPLGGLVWDGKNIVRSVNGKSANSTGNVIIPLNYLPLAGNWDNPITGVIAFNAISARICNRHTSGGIVINGGEGNTAGGSLYLQHKDSSSNPGGFSIYTSDGTNTRGFVGTKDGILKWSGYYIPVIQNGWLSGGTNVIFTMPFRDTNYIVLKSDGSAISGITKTNTGFTVSAASTFGWIAIGAL
jgi:hypothetical protein